MKTKFICLIIWILAANLFGQNNPEIYHAAEVRYFTKTDLEIIRHYGHTSIDADEHIYGNVMVADGNLKILGSVTGDVIVINGDIRLSGEAYVGGNIVCVDGRIYQTGRSEANGYLLETNSRNLGRRSENQWLAYDHYRFQHSNWGNYSTLPLEPMSNKVLFRYNRVQGFFAGLNFPNSISKIGQSTSIHGFVGYGFSEKKFRYQLGLDRSFFNRRDYRFELGGKFYDLTDTRDDWYITPLENTLSAVLFNSDYQDYYQRKGFELHASQNLTVFFKASLIYRNDNYHSVTSNTDWALFGKGKSFRDNPEIVEGNMRSLTGELYFDTRNDRDFPFSGWYGRLTMEVSNDKLSSDFYFNQYILDIRNYLPVSRTEQLDFRLRVGSSEKMLPSQKYFEMGGIGTMRGFGFKEFIGNRLILGNLEYKVSLPGWQPMSDLRFIVFADAGDAWFVEDNSDLRNGFRELRIPELKSDLGIAIADWKERIRLNLAKRTDTGHDALVVTLRIAREF